MAEPKRILVAPFTAFVAPLGTGFPLVSDDEAAFDPDWFKLGENGDRNYDDDGVTLTMSDTTDVFRGAGETAPQKVFRTEEDATVAFNLVDMAAAQFAKVLNDATITTVAAGVGIPGEEIVEGYRGFEVAQFELLLRGEGASTETLGLNMQFEFAQVFSSGDPAPVFTKTGPAMLAVEFTPTRAATGEFFEAHIQTAAPQ